MKRSQQILEKIGRLFRRHVVILKRGAEPGANLRGVDLSKVNL